MNKISKMNFENDHLTEEAMLMLVDGELSSKEAENSRGHLETCWTCRRELEKIEETISLFVEFRNNIQIPLQAAPPNNWSGFNANLTKIKHEQLNPRRSWINFSNFSPFQLRLGIASLTVLLIFAFFLQLITVEKVSASRILDESFERQNEKIHSIIQPVIYQKLRVRIGSSKTLNWEVWNDPQNARAKQVIGGELPKESADMLQKLSEILQKNKMNPHKPLAPESFKAWFSSLENPSEEVFEGDVLTVKISNHQITFDGQISEATIKLRRNDLHPFEQILKVRSGGSLETYEITEDSFDVVSLLTLKPNFFEEHSTSNEIVKVVKTEPQSSASPNDLPIANTENLPEVSANSNAENRVAKTENVPKAVADANLEVEVLQLLNSVKADIDEDVAVKRENGVIYVRGLVETVERKNQILSALQPVGKNPAVKIEIQTVAEAVAKNKNQSSNKPTSVENLETKNLNTAFQNDLVKKLGSDSAARSFAARTVNLSSQAMSHVYAMWRLARQFSAAEIKNLSPEAKAKWLNLIASHAKNFVAASENLWRDLDSVFDAPRVSGTVSVEINSSDDLPRAIESLFSIASSNDRVIRSALTISASDAQFSALKSVQFWQSMKNAEALANKIAAVK